MSERWKHQLKMGLAWGFIMCLFSTLFDLREHSIEEQLQTWTVAIRFGIHSLVGIFFMGYVSWKSQQKRNAVK